MNGGGSVSYWLLLEPKQNMLDDSLCYPTVLSVYFFNSSISPTSFVLSLLRGLPKDQMGHIVPKVFQIYICIPVRVHEWILIGQRGGSLAT